MNSLPDELRLLIFIAVQSFVLVAAWRFVSRFVASRLQQAIDTLLLTYAIEYAAVGVLGVLGFLSPTAMLATATLIALGVLFLTRSPGAPDFGELRRAEEGGGSASSSQTAEKSKQISLSNLLPAYRAKGPQSVLLLAASLFIIGYVAAYIWQERYLPPMATDALTYHFPAAVQWLQHGRIDLFETWFFNPANAYSPLAGSTFYAWLLGPIGNDTLAHFASAPMVLLIFFAVIAIAQSLGTRSPRVSGLPTSVDGNNKSSEPSFLGQAVLSWSVIFVPILLGLAIALSRPIVSQIDKGKDDLFLAGFFAAAVAGLSQRRMRDPLGPWRIGIAVGLCVATKYTALLAMPMLLLAIDAPVRAGWRWRQWRTAAGCVLAIAGPWFVRNVVATGNPLFPADFLWFHGLLSTARSIELRSIAGVMGVLLNGPFAVPGALGGALLVGWLLACVAGAKRSLRDPLARLCLFGPIAGVAIFVALSPYAEIRFIVPALVLITASVGLLTAGSPRATTSTSAVESGAPSAGGPRSRAFGRSANDPVPNDSAPPLPVSPKGSGKSDQPPPMSLGMLDYEANRRGRSLGERLVAHAWLPAGVIASASIATALSPDLWATLATFCLTGAVTAVLGIGAVTLQTRVLRLKRDALIGIAAIGALLLAGYAYVNWTAFVNDRQADATLAWASDSRGKLWAFVRDELPPGETIAYTGTFTVYPLMGYHLDRPVVYAPLLERITRLADLPRLGDHLSGEQIQLAALNAAQHEGAAHEWWLQLQHTHAKHLAVFWGDAGGQPIEMEFIRSMPQHFQREYTGVSGAVYRITGF